MQPSQATIAGTHVSKQLTMLTVQRNAHQPAIPSASRDNQSAHLHIQHHADTAWESLDAPQAESFSSTYNADSGLRSLKAELKVIASGLGRYTVMRCEHTCSNKKLLHSLS